MCDFVCIHLGSIGLALDIVGVAILFFVVVQPGEQVIRIDEEEERKRFRKLNKKQKQLKFGFALVVSGFFCQIGSTEIGIWQNSSDKPHLKTSQTIKNGLVDTSRLNVNQPNKAK